MVESCGSRGLWLFGGQPQLAHVGARAGHAEQAAAALQQLVELVERQAVAQQVQEKAGIEIAGGSIRLVRWVNENGVPIRKVAEEESLMLLAQRIMGY